MRKALLIIICLAGLLGYSQNTHILPTPQQVEFQKGTFVWQENRIESKLVEHLEVPRNEDQAYRLTINKKGVLMEATTETGLFYAEQSLKQLRRYATLTNTEIPCMTILDWPDLKLRAWQDDISRGPIVTMDYLKQIIPQLAECKLNGFSLYTEHTFRTESHPDIAPIDAFTAKEIKELDAFCKQYHIELIGNQQCFAHFEEILKNPFYEYLADAPDNLNPGIEATYEFLDDIIGEEAQAYSSPLFNINCDETESLGSGKAKAYVDAVGSEKAYYLHINRVNDIVKRHGKRTMMWGDIADQHPEILENLDKDIIFLAWNYAGRDSYDDFLKPYVASGHEFVVAPGVSLSERVLPKYDEFILNIPNLCRDGFKSGAMGMLNTCWDDFGESLTQNALYGLALGAEKSWNTSSTDDAAINHSIHFLGQTTDDYVKTLRQASRIAQNNQIGPFLAFTKGITPFYPSLVDAAAQAENLAVLNEIATLERQGYQDDNLHYALHRMAWCAQRNLTRCQLYQTLQAPTEENVKESKQQIKSLLADLHQLKCEYIKIWERECRPCWLEVNMKKYDDIVRELQRLPFQPFIESEANEDGKVVVTLRTLYNDQPIHYTIDGKVVANDDPVYNGPITLERSSLVRACCFDNLGRAIRAERYFIYHKGMGKFRKLNSVPGNYRPEYSGGGDNALVDGYLGSNDYQDGHWQGFYGVDADIELDFRQTEAIHAIEMGFLVNAHDWILRANEVEIYTSSNGKDYRLSQRYAIQTEVDQKGNFVFRETIPFKNLSTRYLRIVVKNPGLIPEGLPGHGYDSWIFMDELIIQ